MGKKVKKDEKPPPDDVFDALLVESRQAATVVLMLNSPEEDVQSKACEAIYKFVDKCEENKKLLLDLNAMDPLLRLMQGEDHTVRRHATMALGVMCQHPEVRKCLRKKDTAIPALIHLLQPEVGDLVVNEFAALAVSYMATEFSSKVTIFDNGGIEPLVKLLSSVDPDVQKNSIEALAQMALDYQARGSVREYDGFPPILEMLKSEYAIIQKLALLALDRLMQDVENRSHLREMEGISKLLDFLAKPEWSDHHVMVIMVIASLLEDFESLEHMKESGGLKKLVALITDQPAPEEEAKSKGDKKGGSRAGKKSAVVKDPKGKKGGDDEENKETAQGGDSIIPTLPDVKMCAAKAIARCARNSENRKMLHEQEAEKMLIILLTHESPDVQACASQAIGVMCENLSCQDSVREWEGLPPLVKLLATDNTEVKEAVTLALANLTSSNIPNCQEIVNLNGLGPLISALSDKREEVVANAACVLTNMAQDEALRAEAQNKSVVFGLIEPLGSSNTNVQSKAALAVSAFACDADSRAELRENDGLEPLVMLLHSGNDEVRRNAAWAVTVAGVDEPTATEICNLGGLEILQQIQLSSTRKSPFIDAALERLLDSNLSAKYALTGNLSQMNLIENGFYDPGQLKPGTKFRTLEDYLEEPLNDKRPVFFITAKQEVSREPIEKTDESDYKSESKIVSGKASKATKQDSKSKSKAQREKEEKQREEELAAQLQREQEAIAEQVQKPLEPPFDSNFVKFLEDVTDKIMPLVSTKEQIVALAQFVSEKMGGAIEKGQLPYFGWELPLSQVRFDGKTNVVPIGKVKMGIHTHRALLFKALADRLSIGCTLTRGQYNRAWNEVLVAEENEEAGAPKYPPSPFIVDLIHEPGRLLPVDSHEAVAYQKI
ncbi:armadillo repeat-containing protein 3-like isoform X2 [Littorina saxatilis]|uniref:EDR1/CTR1/ARMC3-like peptidase-like domain-containing protein n=1 Tax=Littorina saxatilis TaxID=31220 RepID=A0AAN9G7V7_9CAEN